MASPQRREVSESESGGNNSISQDDARITVSDNLPYERAHAVVRVIPSPRNEDFVQRTELVNRLSTLLPPSATEYCSAALYGLAGSGKTQIALDYAYKRCRDSGCSVLWVHAASDAAILHDYRNIAKHLGIDTSLQDERLLDAVRYGIEALERWVLILDNADELSFFGIAQEQQDDLSQNNFIQVPRAPSGVVLWTSRDEKIVGTLVGARRGIGVGPMDPHESTKLLGIGGNAEMREHTAGAMALLNKLEWLPLAMSLAAAYMRQTSIPAEEYLKLLEGNLRRRQVFNEAEIDRHRRPVVPDSVLETWLISMERIREENEVAFRMMNVVAYMNHRNIPLEILAEAGKQAWDNKEGVEDGDESGNETDEVLVVQRAILRLQEFSFLKVLKVRNTRYSYEMHRLVQEAARYQGSTKKENNFRMKAHGQNGYDGIKGEMDLSGIAVQILCKLFPPSEQETWWQCDQYLAHAITVSEWTKGCGKQAEAAELLSRVAGFLDDQGRWREKEPVDEKALQFRHEVLGERHPDTISSMTSLATTYHAQGHYEKTEAIDVKVLDLRREVLGEKHPDTISSMTSLGTTFHAQGHYAKAEAIYVQVLDLRREILGEKHPDTIWSMTHLAATYHAQGYHHKAEAIYLQSTDLRREVLGVEHPDTISSMASLATTFHAQGHYAKAEAIYVQVLDLRRKILGEKHPDTIISMTCLATTYYQQGHYDMAEAIDLQVLNLRREVLGEKHPDTISSMASLATTYHVQGHYAKADVMKVQVMDARRETRGARHPETLQAMHDLATSWYAHGRHKEAISLMCRYLNSQ